MEYRARDIQEYLKIKKIRYEYLQTKIGISPDGEQASTQGSYHKFSFKNFLQFIWAHNGNRLGFSPSETGEMLDVLDKFDEQHSMGIYKERPMIDVKLYFIVRGNYKEFVITTPKKWGRYPCNIGHIEILKAVEKRNYLDPEIPDPIEYMGRLNKDAKKSLKTKSWGELLESSDGYTVLNLDALKNKLLAALE